MSRNAKNCDKLIHNSHDDIAWRCQGSINPYTEDIPSDTACHTQYVGISNFGMYLLPS